MPDTPPRPDLAAFLQSAHTLSLSTVDDAGLPHAASLWYVADDQFRFHFVSDPSSAHCRHVARQPAVALTIHADVTDPMQIRGVQAHGRCEMVPPGADLAQVLSLFAGKFPAVAADPRFAVLLASQRFYRITPTWLRWLDNRRGFGWKWETV